jgi:hypothetical protein
MIQEIDSRKIQEELKRNSRYLAGAARLRLHLVSLNSHRDFIVLLEFYIGQIVAYHLFCSSFDPNLDRLMLRMGRICFFLAGFERYSRGTQERFKINSIGTEGFKKDSRGTREELKISCRSIQASTACSFFEFFIETLLFSWNSILDK